MLKDTTQKNEFKQKSAQYYKNICKYTYISLKVNKYEGDNDRTRKTKAARKYWNF